MASAPSRPPLREFLIRDISSEGHHLLLPVLTTTDLLHLSECSQGLLGYRYHLSRVETITHPSYTPAMDVGLARLLSGQMWGVHIAISEEKVVKNVLEMVLQIIRSGAMGPHLKGLEVGFTDVEPNGDLLCYAMEEKAWVHLEELVVEFEDNYTRSYHTDIPSLLAQGMSSITKPQSCLPGLYY